MGLIFIIHEVQNEDSLSWQFCGPVLDRDKMIKSSAYNRELSFAPFCKTKGIFKCEREVVNIKIKKK